MIRRIAFLPIVCLIVGACQRSTEVNTPLDLDLSVDRTIVDSANPLEITITLVNRGAHEVQVHDPRNYTCPSAFEVRNEAGQPIALPVRLCDLILYGPRTLDAGDSIIIRDRWSADMSDGNYGSAPVAIGSYRITARMYGDGRELTTQPVVVAVSALGGS